MARWSCATDGRLRTYTIVAGTCYYDGHQFPENARRNVFVPEAGGHLIGRLRLSDGIASEATRFYPAEQEFLASTDERFRPVNARVGPDGALYIADMYHGIIEHQIFMVPWLTKQIRERRLPSASVSITSLSQAKAGSWRGSTTPQETRANPFVCKRR